METVSFAREGKAKKKPVFHPIGRPYSFFDFREGQFGELHSLGRLLSQVRSLKAETMVVEELAGGASQDVIEEGEDLKTRLGSRITSKITRLSFFRPAIKNVKELEHASDDDFLGYVIIKDDQAAGKPLDLRVYESVLKSSRHQNNYVRKAPSWHCRVGRKSFKVTGYLYAQQNGLTNVCAHVALRTAASVFHPQGDISYRKINELLGIDHKDRRLGCAPGEEDDPEGLDQKELLTVLEAAGARCIRADYSKRRSAPPYPYQRYVYGSIESGFPALLVFDTTNGGAQHVVPVFGHTLNQDLWVPNAERLYFQVGNDTRFLPSDSWLSSFIVHDDNWGSNFCCPKHFLKPLPSTKTGRPSKRNPAQNSEWVAHVIATVPQQVKLNPLHAEVIGLDFLFAILKLLPADDNAWGDRLRRYANEGLIIFRPLLITGAEYADHLTEMQGWKHTKLPSYVPQSFRTYLGTSSYWMVEMSVPELFSSNLRKVGEVLLKSDEEPAPGERYFRHFMAARLPGHFALPPKNAKGQTSLKFEFITSEINSHVRVFGLPDHE